MNSFPKWFSTNVKCQIYIYLALLFLLVACKDDDDIPSPRVTVDLPIENQVLFTIDTFLVKASISHEAELEWVEMELVTADFAPVAGRERFTISGQQAMFEAVMIIDEPLRESGLHYIAVRASDGTRVGSGFVKIQLSAVPRALDQVYVAARSSFDLGIWGLEPEGVWEPLFSKNIDCQGVALSYRHNILGMVGGEIGNLDFHSTADFSLISSVPGFGSPSFPFFLGMEYSTKFEEFMVLQREPRLRIFDKIAMPVIGFDLLVNHLPSKVFAANDHYFVLESPISQPNQRLAQYARPGGRLSTLEMGGPVVGVFSKGFDEIFIWENHPEGCRLRTVNYDNELIQEIMQRPGEVLSAVVELSQGVFGILTSQGLYRYNYNSGATIILNTAMTGQGLYYEELSQRYYLANGNDLITLTSTGNVVDQHTFNSEVFWVGFNYNR